MHRQPLFSRENLTQASSEAINHITNTVDFSNGVQNAIDYIRLLIQDWETRHPMKDKFEAEPRSIGYRFGDLAYIKEKIVNTLRDLIPQPHQFPQLSYLYMFLDIHSHREAELKKRVDVGFVENFFMKKDREILILLGQMPRDFGQIFSPESRAHFVNLFYQFKKNYQDHQIRVAESQSIDDQRNSSLIRSFCMFGSIKFPNDQAVQYQSMLLLHKFNEEPLTNNQVLNSQPQRSESSSSEEIVFKRPRW